MAVTSGTATVAALANGSTTTTVSFVSTSGPLYVRVCWWTSALNTITYGGVGLTRVAQSTSSSGGDNSEIWRLLTPTAGTANLVLTFAAGQTAGSVAIVNSAGQDVAGTPEGSTKVAKSAANATSIGTQTITGAATGDLTLCAVTNGNGAAVTPTSTGGGTRTEDFDSPSNGEGAEGFKVADAVASVGASWTGSTSWAFASIVLKAITSSPQTLQPGFISTAESVYAPAISFPGILQPGFIASAEALYEPVVAGGATNAHAVIPFATLGPVRGATGGPTQNHLLYAPNTDRWWFFAQEGVLDSGTATGGTTQTLVDSTKSWSSGQFTGCTCYIIAGTGAGHSFEIGTTTATSIRIQVNDDPATPYTLNFTPNATSQYVIVDTRNITAWVSSTNDLTTATWALASGGRSNNVPNNQAAIDVPGGRWDGNGSNGGGEYPTDGRQFAVGYGNASSHDVVYVWTQTGGHWFKNAKRGRMTAASTMTWDDMSAASTNPWDDTQGGQEALPYFLQGLAYAFDTFNSRWHALWAKTQGMAGAAATVNDPGTGTGFTLGMGWNGLSQTQTFDSASTGERPIQSALVEVGSSGLMLAVYCQGTAVTAGTWGAGLAAQTGLRWLLSSSATAWPTTSTAATVPNLSSASNSPNDWGLVARTTTDVHVVRRNSATVLEHVRFNGTSWGSATTLPTAGLTGHEANSGVNLATDGTDVWCIILDSDASHTVKYLRWSSSSGQWGTAWATLITNTNAKTFLIAARRASISQIGIAWTEGPDASARFAVMASSISTALGQTVAPGFVSSGETVYAPSIVANATLLPGFVSSAETLYAPSLALQVLPGFVASAEVLYGPSQLALEVNPDPIGTAETVYAPTIGTGAFAVQPGFVGSGEVVYAPLVSASGPPPQTLGLGFIGSGELAFAPQLNLRVGPLGFVTTGEAVFAPLTTRGGVVLGPTFVGSGEALFAPTLIPGATRVFPNFIGSGELVYGPAGLALQVRPGFVASSETLYLPTVAVGTLVIQVTFIASGELVYGILIQGGALTSPRIVFARSALAPAVAGISTLSGPVGATTGLSGAVKGDTSLD